MCSECLLIIACCKGERRLFGLMASMLLTSRSTFLWPWPEAVNYPDDVEEALRYAAGSREAIVITEASSPFIICEVNAAWMSLCGYSREEAVGRSFRFAQGALTDSFLLESISHCVHNKESGQVVLTNYKKSGQAFRNHLRLKPLRYGPSQEILHYMGILEEVPPLSFT